MMQSLKPNAGGEPRAMAGARYERRLLGVGSSARFGAAWVSCAALAPGLMALAFDRPGTSTPTPFVLRTQN
jgi:hypothetical protein